MDFIRGQNTPYFSWYFDIKIWFRPRTLPGLSRNVPQPGLLIKLAPVSHGSSHQPSTDQPGWLASCNTDLKVVSAHRSSPAHEIRSLLPVCFTDAVCSLRVRYSSQTGVVQINLLSDVNAIIKRNFPENFFKKVQLKRLSFVIFIRCHPNTLKLQLRQQKRLSLFLQYTTEKSLLKLLEILKSFCKQTKIYF